jgi:hypothetical protein
MENIDQVIFNIYNQSMSSNCQDSNCDSISNYADAQLSNINQYHNTDNNNNNNNINNTNINKNNNNDININNKDTYINYNNTNNMLKTKKNKPTECKICGFKFINGGMGIYCTLCYSLVGMSLIKYDDKTIYATNNYGTNQISINDQNRRKILQSMYPDFSYVYTD